MARVIIITKRFGIINEVFNVEIKNYMYPIKMMQFKMKEEQFTSKEERKEGDPKVSAFDQFDYINNRALILATQSQIGKKNTSDKMVVENDTMIEGSHIISSWNGSKELI